MNTLTNSSSDMRRITSDILEVLSGIPADFPYSAKISSTYKQNDRLGKPAQPVKEAGFYVLDDDAVKEDYTLFFKFL